MVLESIQISGGYWTVPQLPINKEERNSKWNKPLAMIQGFLVPIAVCYLSRLSSSFTPWFSLIKKSIELRVV